jgi:hypothetical protein
MRVGSDKLSIKIFAGGRSASISQHNAVWVEHGDDEKMAVIPQFFCFFALAKEKLNESFEHV